MKKIDPEKEGIYLFLRKEKKRGRKKPITEKKREKEGKKGKNLLTLRIEIG